MIHTIAQKRIIGHFSRWAIELSPDCVPDELMLACMLLTVGTYYICPRDEETGERFYRGTKERLETYLTEMIFSIDEIKAWGKPKMTPPTANVPLRIDAPQFYHIDIHQLIRAMINSLILETY